MSLLLLFQSSGVTGVAASTFGSGGGIFDGGIFDPGIFDAGTAVSWSTTAAGAEGYPGVAASAFTFSTAAAGVENVPGVAASSFGWSTDSAGAAGATGTTASEFGWSTDSAGTEDLAGTSASAFVWTTAGAGAEDAPGVADSAFGWSTAATGDLGLSGAAASAFTFSTEGIGAEDLPGGVAASEFGWSTEAASELTVTGDGASAFTFSTEATGSSDLVAVTGVAASTFGVFSTVFDGGIFDGDIFDTIGRAVSWSTEAEGLSLPTISGTSDVTFRGRSATEMRGLYNGAPTDDYIYEIGAFESHDGGQTFTRNPATPIISPTGSGWNSLYVKDPSTPVWDGANWHTYIHGWDGSNHTVGHYLNDDRGMDPNNWVEEAGNPVCGVLGDGSYRENGAIFAYVTLDGGRPDVFRMWVSGSQGVGGVWTIGLLTSPTGMNGSWTDHGRVLDLGGLGDPDEIGLIKGCVLETGTGTDYLYYGAIPASGFYHGAYATFTDPTDADSYIKGGVLAGYAGDITVDGHLYRSNVPREIFPFDSGYKVLWDCWNADGSPLEQCFEVLGTDPITFAAPSGTPLFSRNGGWDDNSAENPTIAFLTTGSWETNGVGSVTPAASSDSEFGWSTEGSGAVEGATDGAADSDFGWSTDAIGDTLVITDQSHVAFNWSTASAGIVGDYEPIRAKNRRLRPLMLPRGVWYQPKSNPEGRLE